MRKWGGHLFHFSKLFCDLSGDNYTDYADDVITKLRHQLSTLTFSTSFSMDINYLPAKSMQLQ